MIVHSTFSRACNFITSENVIVTLLKDNTPLAPRSAVLACSDLGLFFQPNIQVSLINGKIITSHGVLIDLLAGKNTETIINSIENKYLSSPSNLTRLVNIIGDFLVKSPPSGGMHDILNGQSDFYPTKTIERIHSALDDFTLWLKNDGNTSSLAQLVGFGIGLTPSADDFILGVMMVLDLYHKQKHHALSLQLYPLLARTTDISAAMLSNACSSRYSLLFSSLFTSPINNIEITLKQIAAHGHSSGHDMLCGVYFALTRLEGNWI
ncbi:DUF2877 domain-containing protein [Aeromonas cavernicola]|uniref:DUF2877 domain-containing protein n=1 Tax=Aeromonas cavernicola TaxID=1006623 RepID=UPI0012FD5510|nr:DUF2877 domain-containing protein [Aeromonas cavernicola]